MEKAQRRKSLSKSLQSPRNAVNVHTPPPSYILDQVVNLGSESESKTGSAIDFSSISDAEKEEILTKEVIKKPKRGRKRERSKERLTITTAESEPQVSELRNRGSRLGVSKLQRRLSRSFSLTFADKRTLKEKKSSNAPPIRKKEKKKVKNSKLEKKKEPPLIRVLDTVHKSHVDKAEATQFLVDLLQSRDERYAHIHHEIHNLGGKGEMFLRPSSTKAEEFRSMLSSPLLQQCNLEVDKNKYVKFWFELVSQPPDVSVEGKYPGSKSSEGSWMFVKANAKSDAVYRRLEYFPENIINIDPGANDKVSFGNEQSLTEEIPSGPPNYVLTFFVSKRNNMPHQILGCIPLTDVKIVLISPVEISISYVNRLANTHRFRFTSVESVEKWLHLFELATQEKVKRVGLSVPVRSLAMFANSMKDLKKFAQGAAEEQEEEVNSSKSYLPSYTDVDELREDSCDCFSPSLQLDECFLQTKASNNVEACWRVLGGTLEDLILWCVLTSNRAGQDNIDFTALLLSQPNKVLLRGFEKVFQGLKNRGDKPKVSTRQFILRAGPTPSGQLSPCIQQKLFYLTEQWLKFLAGPPNEPGMSNAAFRENLLNFCKTRVRSDQFRALKGLNYQLHDYHQFEPLYPSIRLQSVWEEDSPIKSFAELGSQELAEQLTILEVSFHQRIQHHEMLNLKWDTEPALCPNIMAMIENFNIIGMWVATQIILQESPRQQAKAVGKFLRVANKLFGLRNYNSCVQLLSGINHFTVKRLKKMHKHLDQKSISLFKVLNEHFDPVAGYTNYRKLPFDHPCLQLYAVPLRTLTLVEEGNPHYLDDAGSVICFSRLTMIAQCLETLHLYNQKALEYDFLPNPQIQQFLREIVPFSEDQLYEISLEHEPLRNTKIPAVSPRDGKAGPSQVSVNPLFGKCLPVEMQPRPKVIETPPKKSTLKRTGSGLLQRMKSKSKLK